MKYVCDQPRQNTLVDELIEENMLKKKNDVVFHGTRVHGGEYQMEVEDTLKDSFHDAPTWAGGKAEDKVRAIVNNRRSIKQKSQQGKLDVHAKQAASSGNTLDSNAVQVSP